MGETQRIVVVSAVGLSRREHDMLARVNQLLDPEDHAVDCPVRHGASADCVWPIAVCAPYLGERAAEENVD